MKVNHKSVSEGSKMIFIRMKVITINVNETKGIIEILNIFAQQ
jgi:hypothetical protein